MTMKERIVFIDNLKFLGIIFVILGHALQYTSGEYFKENIVFNFIYTFHMPLFMILSGYFFHSSLELSPINFLYKKFYQLLMPAFCWGAIKMCMINGGYVSVLIGGFWFLKSTFLCYLITFSVTKLLKSERTSYCILFLLPFIVNLNYSTFMLNYMLPSFIVGIWLRLYHDKIMKYRNVLIIICLICYIVCLPYWNFSEFNYVSVYNNGRFCINNEIIYIHRMLLGLSGSVAIFLIFSFHNESNKYISLIGQSTLGLYTMNALFSDIYRHLFPYSVYSEFLCFIISVFVTILQVPFFLYAINMIKKNKWSSLLLLGQLKKQ